MRRGWRLGRHTALLPLFSFFSSSFSRELAQMMQLRHRNLNKQIKGICLELAVEQNSCSR